MLTKLAFHWPTLLISAVCWQLIMLSSHKFSPIFAPAYKTLSTAKQHQWDIRVVAFLHAVLISYLAYGILADPTLNADRLFGYDFYAGQVYAIASGYFLWDSIISAWHIREYGPSFLIHGVLCFLAYVFSFTPFVMYYGAVFLMFELSTPFLNVHWMLDKAGLTGSKWQLINGVLLGATFFLVRLCFGTYMSYQFFRDVSAHWDRVPSIHFYLYASANVILNTLNFIWFFKIVESVRKRGDASARHVKSRQHQKQN